MTSIDTSFDFRTDSNGGDPDQKSPTLRKYHQILWSKPLPNGQLFSLSDTTSGIYLHHKSDLGEFFLSSDAISHSYRNWKRMEKIIAELPPGTVDSFLTANSTIGSYTLFPGNKIDKKPTINGARGLSQIICDRFDLTLECVRLFYKNEESPLAETLTRYRAFFQLFGDFEGYVKFFLFHDLVNDDFSEVKFHLPFNGFESKPIPKTVEQYVSYMANSRRFNDLRNQRIERYANLSF